MGGACYHVWLCVQDDARVQKMTKRMHTLEEVNNNVKLLSEMLSHYDQDRSSDADRDLMKVSPELPNEPEYEGTQARSL